VQAPEIKKKHLYQVRVAATNGKSTWDLCWVKVRPREVQSGLSVSAYRYHSSFHQSGEIRISKEPASSPLGGEVPAVAQIGSGTWKREPLDQLKGAERVASFVLPIDENSLQDYPPFRKKKEHDSVVYIDTRFFVKNCVSIEIWVAPSGYFFKRMPEPPGFRSIFDLPLCWVVIDVEST